MTTMKDLSSLNLSIDVHCASKLVVDDAAEVNPFVKFTLNGKKYMTFVNTNTLEPQWDQNFDLSLEDNKDKELMFGLWKLIMTTNKMELLGSTAVDISTLQKESKHTAWYHLTNSAGFLKLSLRLHSGNDSSAIKEEEKSAAEAKQNSTISLWSTAAEDANCHSLMGGTIAEADINLTEPSWNTSNNSNNDDPNFKLLRRQFPRCTEAQILHALSATSNDVVDAGTMLLSEQLPKISPTVRISSTTDAAKINQNNARPTDPIAPIKIAASPLAPSGLVGDTDVVPWLSPHPSPRLPNIQITSTPPAQDKHQTLIQDLQSLFPHLGIKRLFQALMCGGWETQTAVDSLLDDQIAMFSMQHQAQTLASSAIGHVLNNTAPINNDLTASFVAYNDGKKVQAQQAKPHGLSNHSKMPVQKVKPYKLTDNKQQQQGPQIVPASGKRKALLIGVNYFGSKHELSGCIADVKRVRKFIANVYGFPDHPNYMTVLTDDNPDERLQPTKRNIQMAMKWLVRRAECGDVLFFHFSGHGSQTKDISGDEGPSGLDQVILPMDYARAGHILDDELYKRLVHPLPQGAKLTAFLDCCHSGTGMDLPYTMKSEAGWTCQMNPKFAAADIRMISGCKDCQQSADVNDSTRGKGGALTLAVIASLTKNPFSQSYVELMRNVTNILTAQRLPQRPQLSSTQPFCLTQMFGLTEILTPLQYEQTLRRDVDDKRQASSRRVLHNGMMRQAVPSNERRQRM